MKSENKNATVCENIYFKQGEKVMKRIIAIVYNEITYYRIFGFFLILCSLSTVYRCRHQKRILLLFAIIAYINICVAVLDMFLMGEMSNEYQYSLRHSEAGLMYAKLYN